MTKHRTSENTSNTVDPTKDDYFENFCGACDNFMSLDCPFISVVKENTKWKYIGCRSFWN